MTKKLNELIDKSVRTNSQNLNLDNSLADQLIKNADKAMGITEERLKINSTKNLTFTFGIDDFENINQQVEPFLTKGKNVSKSELMRIGLRLIELTDSKELANLTLLITKHKRGR